MGEFVIDCASILEYGRQHYQYDIDNPIKTQNALADKVQTLIGYLHSLQMLRDIEEALKPTMAMLDFRKIINCRYENPTTYSYLAMLGDIDRIFEQSAYTESVEGIIDQWNEMEEADHYRKLLNTIEPIFNQSIDMEAVQAVITRWDEIAKTYHLNYIKKHLQTFNPFSYYLFPYYNRYYHSCNTIFNLLRDDVLAHTLGNWDSIETYDMLLARSENYWANIESKNNLILAFTKKLAHELNNLQLAVFDAHQPKSDLKYNVDPRRINKDINELIKLYNQNQGWAPKLIKNVEQIREKEKISSKKATVVIRGGFFTPPSQRSDSDASSIFSRTSSPKSVDLILLQEIDTPLSP